MNPEQWKRVKQVLDEAISLDPAQRGCYLDRACDGDAELRREVESLLSSHEQAGPDFLQTPAVDLCLGPPPVPTRVGKRIGAYDILEVIGHGGMGEVYRAVRADGQFTKDVAVKMVRGGFDTASVIERFRQERQILAGLDQPNIARLLDGGTTEDGVPYLVMELVNGTPINVYCGTHRLDVSSRLNLFLQVCAAVQYAHQRLVIHRDIKPGNILVTEGGEPKLLDFGVAKILDPAVSSETTIAHPLTPEFASPEQIRGEPITTATDVYSLGVVFYQLLTGLSPYPGNTRTPHEFARTVCEFEPKPPSTVILNPGSSPAMMRSERIDATEPTVPSPEESSVWEGSPARLRRRLAGDLDVIVLKALRKEPQRRYVSVEQMAEDIRRHLQGLPVAAVPDSLAYRTGKFVRRHRLGVAAAAAILIAIAGGVGATIREARIAAANEQRAERRFNDVRQLSDTLMFEVHDSVENLPGATPARKLIVQRSLEYLNRLAKDSGGDIALQRELANAYERIGRVQGDPEGSNLGDIAGASDSFSKALRIRQQIASTQSDSNVLDLTALAGSYREMCGMNLRFLGNVGSALENCRKALNIAEKLHNGEPANRTLQAELAKAYEAFGRVYGDDSTVGNAGNFHAALDNHSKARALVEDLTRNSPNDPKLSSWRARLSMLTADDLFFTGKMSEAVPLYQEAMRTFEDLAGQNNDPSYKRSLALSYQRMGDMLLTSGRYAPSLTYYRKELETTTTMVAADPQNMVSRIDLAASYATYGHALWRAGRVEEAIASLQHGFTEVADSGQTDSRAKGLELTLRTWMAGALERSGNTAAALANYLQARDAYQAICASDPKDVEDCLELAGVRDQIGRIYLRQGKINEAFAEYQKALALSEPLSAGAEPNLEALYTVVNIYYGFGEVHLALAQRAWSREKRAHTWQESQSWYQKSRSAILRIPHWCPITPDEFDSRSRKQIEARLALRQSATSVGQRGFRDAD